MENRNQERAGQPRRSMLVVVAGTNPILDVFVALSVEIIRREQERGRGGEEERVNERKGEVWGWYLDTFGSLGRREKWMLHKGNCVQW